MKKRIVIIIGLLVAVASYTNAEKFKSSDQEVLSRAFENSKSKLECFNTSYSGKTGDKFLNIEQLGERAKEYIDILDIEKVEKEVVEEKNMNQISIYGQVGDGENITLIFYSYIDEDKRGESTIFIDVSGSSNYKKFVDIGSKISKVLKEDNIKADNASCIIGTYKGQLEDEHKMRIIAELVSSTKSEEVESLVEDSVMSYSLFSKNIDDYIYSGKNRVNLNIAIRYNEYKDETYIFIASPIITMGY